MLSFEEYVAARRIALVRFAYLLTGERQLAQDLVQEVLARIHQRWPSVQRSGSPDAYVKKAILHQFLSWRRRRSATESVMAEPPNAAIAADPATDYVERDATWRLLATLPRRQRAVLVLRYYEDLDDSQIAAELGCAPSTVRAHASRAIGQLRIVLAKDPIHPKGPAR